MLERFAASSSTVMLHQTCLAPLHTSVAAILSAGMLHESLTQTASDLIWVPLCRPFQLQDCQN